MTPRILLDTPRRSAPDVSLVLLDWSCRESFHLIEYLANQTVARDRFEVIWIEYYDRVVDSLKQQVDAAKAAGVTPPIDRWIVLDLPHDVYYHKHFMYNVGILASRGRIVVICDSDAMATPTFVETIITAFERDPGIALHLDEVRNVNRDYYPFNHPSFEQVLGDGCINWRDGKTTGLSETVDPIHALNYGACFCALRDDLIRIGGADEHLDYLGHICGPYELTWRLVNDGKREVWHQSEFLYHTWHPGTDGENNYVGPHDGRNVSTTSLRLRRSGRVTPLTENAMIRTLREGGRPSDALAALVQAALPAESGAAWKMDEVRRAISAGRAEYSRGNHAGAVEVWTPVLAELRKESVGVSDFGWASYHIGRLDDAEWAFAAALALDAENATAVRGAAWTALQQQNFELASQRFQAASHLVDTWERDRLQDVYRGWAWAEFHAGRIERALEHFRAALDYAGPSDRAALQDLQRGAGWSLLRLNRTLAAQESFLSALPHIDPGEAVLLRDVQNGLIQCARQSRSSSASAPAVEVTVHLSAPAAAAMRVRSRLQTGLARALYQAGAYEDALECFEEAFATDAGNSHAVAGAAWAQFHRGKWNDAEARFNRLLIETTGLDAAVCQQALRGRGWVRLALGRFAEAGADFDGAIERSAADPVARQDAQRGRARASYWLGETQQAREHAGASRGGSRFSRPRLAVDAYGARMKLQIGQALRRLRESRT